MKNILAFLFVLLCLAYADDLAPIQFYYNYGASDTSVNVEKLRYNADSALSFGNRAAPAINGRANTLNLYRGDSTFHKINVDSIRSNPTMDSISGKPFIDILKTKKITVPDSVKCANIYASDSLVANNLKTLGSVKVNGGLGIQYKAISDSSIANGYRIIHSVVADSVYLSKGLFSVMAHYDSLKIGSSDWIVHYSLGGF